MLLFFNNFALRFLNTDMIKSINLWIFFLILNVVVAKHAYSQTIATLEVEAGNLDRVNTIVGATLDHVTMEPESNLKLVEVRKQNKVATPMQVRQDASGRKLWWIMEGVTKAGQKRVYELVKEDVTETGKIVKTVKDDSVLVVYSNGNPVLQYYHETILPPVGIDAAYRRSGFIHPLWSPLGAVLTTIQPKDHFHHYGIWNPWTKTVFEGDTIDFWNLGDKQGTVRFSGFSSIYSGPVYGGFKAVHEHVVLKDNQSKVALNEEIDVVVWNQPVGRKVHLWDFTSTLSCASTSPITLKEYRYGGFGYRATEEWTNKNSKILTSEGRDRKTADGSVARWVFVSGTTLKGTAGILFMGYPTNYNYPEPLRVWPENANNNRGDVFINFSPTKNKDWHLEPGKKYVLRYRMMMFDGELTSEDAERYWQDFANPPVVKVIRRRK
jgi:hypothetical protein